MADGGRDIYYNIFCEDDPLYPVSGLVMTGLCSFFHGVVAHTQVSLFNCNTLC